jgi:hypothetical protein
MVCYKTLDRVKFVFLLLDFSCGGVPDLNKCFFVHWLNHIARILALLICFGFPLLCLKLNGKWEFMNLFLEISDQGRFLNYITETLCYGTGFWILNRMELEDPFCRKLRSEALNSICSNPYASIPCCLT